MSRDSMLRIVQPQLERMLGRGRFTIVSLRYVNRMIEVEYQNQYRRWCKLMFSV